MDNMRAVLYVGHGSRVKEGVAEALRFIRSSQQLIDIPIQEISFLELVAPDILTGISKCVARGATEIAIVPILLLTAVHANEDIPLEIKKGKQKYPNITFTYGNTFGVHPKIIDSLYDRIVEQDVAISSNATVLLVGRGSSDPAVKRDLTKIAERLHEKYPFKKVDICFLYGSEPSFPDALQTIKNSATEQVFIIPYLLFTGVLMKGIEKEISNQDYLNGQVVLCECLGYHRNISEVLLERVHELLCSGMTKQVS